jgi:hypothetical protein
MIVLRMGRKDVSGQGDWTTLEVPRVADVFKNHREDINEGFLGVSVVHTSPESLVMFRCWVMVMRIEVYVLRRGVYVTRRSMSSTYIQESSIEYP